MQLSKYRLRTLARIRKFLSFEQAKHLSEAYIISNYKHFINKIHKRNLLVIYEMEDAHYKIY